MRAVLSTGSNMGDSRARLASVVDEFAAELVAASSIYSTPPWGGVEQQDFLNQILIVDVDQTPQELLERCQSLEQKADRVRDIRWGPRSLDVDVVALYRDTGEPVTVDTETLTVPHPRAHERAFVLVPWREVDEKAELGGVGVDKLLEALDPAERDGVKVAR